MGRTCVVPGCTKKSTQGNNVSFHRFPLRQPEKLKQWLEAIGISDVYLAKHHRICSEHFKQSDFYHIHPNKKRIMKDRALPTLNLNNTPKKRGTRSRPGTKAEPLASTSDARNNHLNKKSNGDFTYMDSQENESSFYYQSMPVETSFTNDKSLIDLQKEKIRRQMHQEMLLFEQQMKMLREEMEGKTKERERKSTEDELRIQLCQIQLEKAQIDLEEAKIKMYRFRNSSTTHIKQEIIEEDEEEMTSNNSMLAIDMQVNGDVHGSINGDIHYINVCNNE